MPLSSMKRDVVCEHEAVLEADEGTVYDAVADVATRPEWMTELTAVETPRSPVGAGDRFTGYTSLLLHDFIGCSEVTAAEPAKRLVEQVVIGARFTSEWTFEPAGRGTRLRHRIVIGYPGGPFSPLERWVLRRRMATMQRRSLRALARRLG